VTDVTSQTPSQNLIKKIIKEYNALNYRQAEHNAKQALLNYHKFTSAELVEVHKYLALIYYAQGKLDDSQKEFETSLSLNPDLVLSSLYVSPKIINFFNRVKTEFKLKSQTDEKFALKYVFVEDKRIGAGLRSLALPGWGQIYKGEKKKGITLISLWTASLGGLLVTHLQYNNALQKYKDAEEFKIESKYKTYNSLYKARNSIAVFAGALWLYAYFDATFKKEKPADFSAPDTAHFLTPYFGQNKILFTYRWQFKK